MRWWLFVAACLVACQAEEVYFLDDEGLKKIEIRSKAVTTVSKFVTGHPTCEQRGLGIDSKRQLVAWACTGGGGLWGVWLATPTKYILDLVAGAKATFTRTGVTGVQGGGIMYSEYQSRGWKTYNATVTQTPQGISITEAAAVLSDFDTAGGTCVDASTTYLSYMKTTGGVLTSINPAGRASDFSTIAGLGIKGSETISFPICNPAVDKLLVMSIKAKSSVLYQVDKTDTVAPVQLPIDLPSYLTMTLVGTAKDKNPQGSVVLVSDTEVVFSNDKQIVLQSLDGSGRTVLYDGPSRVGSMAFYEPISWATAEPTEAPNTTAPDTDAPDTPAPDTPAPGTATAPIAAPVSGGAGSAPVAPDPPSSDNGTAPVAPSGPGVSPGGSNGSTPSAAAGGSPVADSESTSGSGKDNNNNNNNNNNGSSGSSGGDDFPMVPLLIAIVGLMICICGAILLVTTKKPVADPFEFNKHGTTEMECMTAGPDTPYDQRNHTISSWDPSRDNHSMSSRRHAPTQIPLMQDDAEVTITRNQVNRMSLSTPASAVRTPI